MSIFKTKKLLLTAALSLMVFLGCKYYIEIELNLQKAISVATSKDASYTEDTDVKIKFQMSSTSKCDQEKDSLSALLSKYYKAIKETKCITEDANTFLEVTATTNIRNLKYKIPDSQKYMVGLVAEETARSIDIMLAIDKKKLDALNEEIKTKYMMDTKLENIEISLKLVNDTSEKSNLRIYSSYVKQKPYPMFGDFTLNSSDSLEIKISDVMKEYINEVGSRRIIEIRTFSTNGSSRKTEQPEKENSQPTKDTGKKSYSDDENIIIE